MMASNCDNQRCLLAVEMDGLGKAEMGNIEISVGASGRCIHAMQFLRALVKQLFIAVGALAIASFFLAFIRCQSH